MLASSQTSRLLFKTPEEEHVADLVHALRAESYENPEGQEYVGIIWHLSLEISRVPPD